MGDFEIRVACRCQKVTLKLFLYIPRSEPQFHRTNRLRIYATGRSNPDQSPCATTPTVREPWQKLKEYFMNWRSSRADQVPNAQALLTRRRRRHPWFLRRLPWIGLSSTPAWISSSMMMG